MKRKIKHREYENRKKWVKSLFKSIHGERRKLSERERLREGGREVVGREWE
jgi:hypothetical protein